jgi:NAD(P)-dependent dehydrogenase (short-subunit alcohol dehydrogenase family)
MLTHKNNKKTVISANRDPNHPTSKALSDLPKGKGSKLIVVKYDATVESDAFGVVDQLRQDGINIAHLDIVVANAGIAKYYPFVKDVKRAQIQEHLDVNVFGVVALYQATRELLRKSPRTGEDGKKKPVFVPVGSSAGTLGYVVTTFPFPPPPRHP